jgi:hypothetical protein
LAGKCRSNSIVASNPPADPPTPTIGQFKFFLADFDLDFAFARFGCDDFVLLVFVLERDALLFGGCFAAMAFLTLVLSRASYKRPFGGEHLRQRMNAALQKVLRYVQPT